MKQEGTLSWQAGVRKTDHMGRRDKQTRRELTFLKKLPGTVPRYLEFVSLNFTQSGVHYVINFIIHSVCAFGAHLGDNIP